MLQRVEKEIGGRKLVLEVGEVAKQANGAVLVWYGETVVLVTAVVAPEVREGIDFVPLTVDYRERAYAAGKIPGGFFKREGRPSEREILTSRLIDRPIRPLFPEGFAQETQVIAQVLSADTENNPDILAMIGASTALTVSDIPFRGPIGAVRIGRIEGTFIINPTRQQLSLSDLDLVIAGVDEGIVMVEGSGREVPESVLIEGLEVGHQAIREMIALQRDLRETAGKPKPALATEASDLALTQWVNELATPRVRAAIRIPEKQARERRMAEVLAEVLRAMADLAPEQQLLVPKLIETIERDEMRTMILEEGIRADGRRTDEIRPISIRVGVLPRTHGSALFTRGETQALVVSTLGTSTDEQIVDELEGKSSKAYMLHYNFPPFSVGEVSPMRGPGRREIGHGALAERSTAPILPSSEQFPYTIRVVSEILESNGSSSMATVCGATLALMDAGVPILAPVAGIAMGLISEPGRGLAVLSDILGLEDHLGDMDFKVAGTASGITGFQLDVKIGGVGTAILRGALEQARQGRLFILEKMASVIAIPRAQLSTHAPRIISIRINPDKIREVIGPGGKVIRSIIEKTGANIDIEDDGRINIASADEQAARAAIELIRGITAEAEIGKIYRGKVKKITDFGAFVEIFPGTDGLVHISQIAEQRIKSVSDVLKEGEEVMVKVLDIDKQGRVKLSRREALREAKESHDAAPAETSS
ncbi:MAG TPA: polyribonucleotide nucleotidyltransferase [Candidatus Tectomicrobia bacterium]|nr:polyribonucleotide nucleotidyltransferase [Candidatus Tectomicrobia bacterium]